MFYQKFEQTKERTNERIFSKTEEFCGNILTFDPAVNQETDASGRRYQDITLTVDGLNSMQLRRPPEAGGRQTRCQSWSQLQLKFELQFEAVRTSSQQRAWALRTPGGAAQQNEKGSAAIVGGTGVGSICCSLFSLQHSLSHTTLSQPFLIKCERYIFLKKCVHSSLLLIMFPHVYIYIYTYSCIMAIQHCGRQV